MTSKKKEKIDVCIFKYIGGFVGVAIACAFPIDHLLKGEILKSLLSLIYTAISIVPLLATGVIIGMFFDSILFDICNFILRRE